MSGSSASNIPNLILMIRPSSFGFNSQTARSNSFQKAHDNSINVSEKAIDEFNEMVNNLRRENLEVIVFDDLQKGLPDSVFSNNWIAHLPDKSLTIFPMYTQNRREEVRFDIVRHLLSDGIADKVIDLRHAVDEEQFLEGTGSIVFDHQAKLAYGCESPRTDIRLLELYCGQVGYRPITFLSVDLSGRAIYHTNVVMTVCEKFVMICLESIPDILERKMIEKTVLNSGKELIELTYPQMNQFAGNCFEVKNSQGQSYLLMSKTAMNILSENQKETLEKWLRPLPFDITTIETIGGGSVRCMVTGLFKY